jgi:hypothetical protein
MLKIRQTLKTARKLLAVVLTALLALSLAAWSEADTGAFNGGAAQSGLTLAELRQRATDLGFAVSELTSMQKGAYLNIADGFNVVITEDSYNPVYAMKSAADAEDAAKKENAAGYNLPFVNGKFYACVGKGNAAEEAGMGELMGVEPYGGASANVNPPANAAADR